LGWWFGHLTSQSRIESTMVRVPGAESANVESPSPVAKPSMPQIVELIQKKGLRTDVELRLALQVMGPEDFRNLAALWTKKVRENVRGKEARMSAIFDRWFELDPVSAKKFSQDVCMRDRELGIAAGYFRSLVAECAARYDPKWALENLLSAEAGIPAMTHNAALMSEVMRQDPALAKEWMAKLEDSSLRPTILAGYIDGLAKKDPQQALEIALAEKGFERANLVYCAIRAAASQGTGVALQMLEKIKDPGLQRDATFQALSVLSNESQIDPFRFLDDTIGKENLKMEGWLRIFMPQFVESNPSAAAAWATTLPDANRSTIMNWVLELWSNQDPESAVAWIQGKVADPESSAAARSSFEEWGRLIAVKRLFDEGKLQDAIAMVSHGSPSGELAGLVAWKLFQQDPAAAGEWVSSLPPDTSVLAAGNIARSWIVQDPTATAAWVERLPAGPARDAALSNMITMVSEVDAEGASRWVELFADQKNRDSGVGHVFANWVLCDSRAACQWLRGLPGVDDKWKARLMKGLR
jgi:hypothetical protein